MVVESDQEVKVDQETSITDVKFTRQSKSCCELCSVGGSSNVSKESPMSARAANALIENSVREMQSTSSMVYGTVSGLGFPSSTWTVEIVGHVIGRSQSSVADVTRACERRKRKSCRKALVKFDELVRSRNPKTRVRLRLRVRLMSIQSCWILWTELTKSSLEWLTELSKLVLCIAYRKGSEMVPETRGVSEVCRGNRLRQR